MSIKIAITYGKGGVAKTTTAVNVSAILAERGYKVLLVDLDHQSYATSYYDVYDDTLPGINEVNCVYNNICRGSVMLTSTVDTRCLVKEVPCGGLIKGLYVKPRLK